MKTAAQYLADIRAAKGITSNYALSKLTGWSESRLSNWQNGNRHFDDDAALKVAELLEIDPAIVLIDAHMTRSTPAALPAWQRLAERVTSGTVYYVKSAAAPVLHCLAAIVPRAAM